MLWSPSFPVFAIILIPWNSKIEKIFLIVTGGIVTAGDVTSMIRYKSLKTKSEWKESIYLEVN